ncbi:MAG: hypothetical protein AAGF12_34020 [Myxococcota bacterium]
MVRWVWLSLLWAGCFQSVDVEPGARAPGTVVARPGPVTGPTDVAANRCPEEGWCYIQGTPLRALDGFDLGALYAAGDQGAVYRWDGEGWFRLPPPSRADIGELVVRGVDDLWVRSDDLYRFDGTEWTAAGLGGNLRLVGSVDNQPWAYGDGEVYVFDGENWQLHSSTAQIEGELIDLLPFGPDRVWALSRSLEGRRAPSVEAYEYARSWMPAGTVQNPGYHGSLHAVNDEVWVQDGRWFLRWSGAAWVSVDETAAAEAVGASMDETSRVVGTGRHGLAQIDHFECGTVRSVSEGAFCIGRGGTSLREIPGEGWDEVLVDPFAGTQDPAAWGTVAPELWAQEATAAHGNGVEQIYRVRVDDFVRYRDYHLELFNGEAFAPVMDRADASARPVVRQAPIDVTGAGGASWAVSDGELYQLEGARTVFVPLSRAFGGPRITKAHALPDGSVLLLAGRRDAALVLHYDGGFTTELEVEIPSERQNMVFEDIAGTSRDDLWLLATYGQYGRTEGQAVLFHSNGGQWNRRSLWPSWGSRQIETDGDSVLILAGGLHSLPKTVMMSRGGLELPENMSLDVELDGYSSRLWIAEDGAPWLTSGSRTARLGR